MKDYIPAALAVLLMLGLVTWSTRAINQKLDEGQRQSEGGAGRSSGRERKVIGSMPPELMRQFAESDRKFQQQMRETADRFEKLREENEETIRRIRGVLPHSGSNR